MKDSLLKIFGMDEEELRDVLIALAVIALFGWLAYYLGWFKGDVKNVVKPTATQEVQVDISDSDLDRIDDSKDKCPLLAGIAANSGCPADTDGDNIYDNNDNCPKTIGTVENDGCPVVTDTQNLTQVAKPDTDNDGYIDANDQCPLIAGTVRGCPPDSDKDGIIDTDDQCPELAGVLENNGCPADTDGDGIYNVDDSCANLAGVLANKGCPADADADGVYDSDDRCPQLAGVKLNTGCPADADRDGIYDSEDKCPTIAGVKAYDGCSADTDKDGIDNAEDKCPTQAGTVENNGCPKLEITEAERKTITDAVKNVQFFTNSARPTEQSKILLNKVANILKANPTYKLKISGHTDASGADDANLDLSKRRAFACFSYLVNQGIASKRLSHQGFGETQAVADNSTREGRKQNRRVEFELHY